MSNVMLYCWCHIVSASVLLYFTILSQLFPLPVELVVQFPARCSTQVLNAFFLVCCGCSTSYIVSAHIQCQASIKYCKEKSRKYQGVFDVKSRVKIWQVRGIWSQQLEHKQVPQWGTEPGVRKGKRSLLACHTRCKCSMETIHNR